MPFFRFTRPSRAAHRHLPSVWARLAAALSFLAVVSALLAPASMLAQDVRSGKLGGVCSAGAAWGASPDAPGDSAKAAAHCELCASVGLAMPPPVRAAIPCFAGHAVASADVPAQLAPSDPGLPYSRGPPIL